MKVIFLLIALATVFAVVIGVEYLMKLAKKNQSKESEKQKGAIDNEIEGYRKSAENIKEIKEKLNNIN